MIVLDWPPPMLQAVVDILNGEGPRAEGQELASYFGRGIPEHLLEADDG